MRHFAITGMVTACLISIIFSGSLMRATPPWARISAGTRSSAITAAAPASSAIRASSAFVTSQITPPLSISGKLRLTDTVPTCFSMTSILLAFIYSENLSYHLLKNLAQDWWDCQSQLARFRPAKTHDWLFLVDGAVALFANIG